MKRCKLEPNRYEYLSAEDSELYDRIPIMSETELRSVAKELIERLAKMVEAAHRNSRY